MLGLEGRKGQWGFVFDFMFVGLVGSKTTIPGTIDMDLDNLIVELDATFSPESAPTLQFLVGIRVYDVSQKIRFETLPDRNRGTTIVDPIVGMQGTWPLGKKWLARLRADIGGFGAGSEFTYQVSILFDWEFAKRWGLVFGYNILGYRVDQGGVNLDIQFHGIVLGLQFRF